MLQSKSIVEEAVHARLSRFALCVAPSSHAVDDAIERVVPRTTGLNEAPMRDAYRLLLQELDMSMVEIAAVNAPPPVSIVARFSYLSYAQRVAFALVVIEEFSLDDAADIMAVSMDELRRHLMATRDFLFATRVVTRCDA